MADPQLGLKYIAADGSLTTEGYQFFQQLSTTSSSVWGGITGTLSLQADLQAALDAKQATLVSGTNIKTVNGNNLLGAGDVVIAAGATDLTYTAATRLLESSTGADVTLPLVAANAGLMAAADKTKLDAISGTNTGNQTTIAGITGTLAEFNTALTGADFTTGGGTATGANTGDQTITLTGDVTGTGTGSFGVTIANDVVNNAKLTNVNTQTLKGRVTAAAGDPEDLTAAQATTIIETFTSALKGLVPPSGGGTANFLRADGVFAAPPGGGSGPTVGTAVVDFGAFPGGSDASVVITGQAAILAGAKVAANLVATATADHSADEHWVEELSCVAGNIVAGTGFTIYMKNTTPIGDTGIYGQWSVAWQWAA